MDRLGGGRVSEIHRDERYQYCETTRYAFMNTNTGEYERPYGLGAIVEKHEAMEHLSRKCNIGFVMVELKCVAAFPLHASETAKRVKEVGE